MGFSARWMRIECAAEMRRARVIALTLFAAAVMVIWIVCIANRDRKPADIWLYAGLSLAACGLVMGPMIIMTGEDWLIRHTAYGRALTALGDPAALIAEIDREAAAGAEYAHTALLEHWLILFVPSQERAGIAARPIPAADIHRLVFSRADAACVRMEAVGKDGALGCAVIDSQEEWSAVAQWTDAREIKTEWIY